MTARWSPNPGSIHHARELLDRGVHPRRLASAEFRQPLPGFYTPAAAPAALELVARVAQRRLLPHAVVSHASAAEILGVPLPLALGHERSGLLHVTVPPGTPYRAGRHVRVHVRRQLGAVRWAGLVLSDPLAMLCELGPVLTAVELVAACDHLLGPRAPRPVRRRREVLCEEAQQAAGCHGIVPVRRALREAREGVESPKETELRLLLVAAGFVEPRINVEVLARGSYERFRLDLSYREPLIAIEYDGDWHRTDRWRFRRDRRKDDALHELGWHVVRATDADLVDPRALLARLRHLGAPRR